MPSEDWVEGAVKRLLLALGVALVVVLASAISSFVVTAPPQRDALELPEYDRQSVGVEPLQAVGSVEVDPAVGTGSGVVVVDDEHGNSVDRAEVGPLVRALALVGHDVVYFEDGTFEEALDGASAYVVVDPSSEYDSGELAVLQRFTDRGGHLLIVGEPDRRQVSATLFGATVSTDESAVTTVAAQYGIGFGTQYLYDLEENDGNYRHVVATPVGDGFDGTERVTLYTATTVDSQRGTPVLRTVPTTRLSNSDEQRSYTVALVDGNVMAVADASFFTAGRHNVADNERFVASMVEFLVSGQAVTFDTDDDGGDADETPDGDGGADDSGTDNGGASGDDEGAAGDGETQPESKPPDSATS